MAIDLVSAYSFALDQVVRHSEAVEHPLGFTMLGQMPDGRGGYSRLHLWRRDRLHRVVPHSHSGDLRSTILFGAMRNIVWSVEHDVQGGVPIIEVVKAGTNRTYRRIGNARWVLAGSKDYGPGENYDIAAGSHHSNECLTDICVTLVERRRGSGGRAQVARSPEEAAATDRVPTRLTVSELGTMAAELQRRLEAVVQAAASRALVPSSSPSAVGHAAWV